MLRMCSQPSIGVPLLKFIHVGFSLGWACSPRATVPRGRRRCAVMYTPIDGHGVCSAWTTGTVDVTLLRSYTYAFPASLAPVVFVTERPPRGQYAGEWADTILPKVIACRAGASDWSRLPPEPVGAAAAEDLTHRRFPAVLRFRVIPYCPSQLRPCRQWRPTTRTEVSRRRLGCVQT
jgi:hypothetical protein